MRPLIACLIVTLVSACGPARPKLEPPGLRIVRLELAEPDSTSAQAISISLRVRNTAEAELPAHAETLELLIDGRPAATLEFRLGLDIPPLGSEVVTLQSRLDTRDVSVLAALARGERSTVPYQLRGEARGAEFSLEVNYEGWLNATPGRPGSFR